MNKSVDLPVVSRVPSLNKEQLNLLIEKEVAFFAKMTRYTFSQFPTREL